MVATMKQFTILAALCVTGCGALAPTPPQSSKADDQDVRERGPTSAAGGSLSLAQPSLPLSLNIEQMGVMVFSSGCSLQSSNGGTGSTTAAPIAAPIVIPNAASAAAAASATVVGAATTANVGSVTNA